MNKFFTQILFATLLTAAQLNCTLGDLFDAGSAHCANKILELYQKVPRCTPNHLWKGGWIFTVVGGTVTAIPMLVHNGPDTGLGILFGSTLTCGFWLVGCSIKRQLDEQSGTPESAALLQFQKDANV